MTVVAPSKILAWSEICKSVSIEGTHCIFYENVNDIHEFEDIQNSVMEYGCHLSSLGCSQSPISDLPIAFFSTYVLREGVAA